MKTKIYRLCDVEGCKRVAHYRCELCGKVLCSPDNYHVVIPVCYKRDLRLYCCRECDKTGLDLMAKIDAVRKQDEKPSVIAEQVAAIMKEAVKFESEFDQNGKDAITSEQAQAATDPSTNGPWSSTDSRGGTHG